MSSVPLPPGLLGVPSPLWLALLDLHLYLHIMSSVPLPPGLLGFPSPLWLVPLTVGHAGRHAQHVAWSVAHHAPAKRSSRGETKLPAGRLLSPLLPPHPLSSMLWARGGVEESKIFHADRHRRRLGSTLTSGGRGAPRARTRASRGCQRRGGGGGGGAKNNTPPPPPRGWGGFDPPGQTKTYNKKKI